VKKVNGSGWHPGSGWMPKSETWSRAVADALRGHSPRPEPEPPVAEAAPHGLRRGPVPPTWTPPPARPSVLSPPPPSMAHPVQPIEPVVPEAKTTVLPFSTVTEAIEPESTPPPPRKEKASKPGPAIIVRKQPLDEEDDDGPTAA